MSWLTKVHVRSLFTMANPFRISNLESRKDRLYGHEFGHSYKNEVRKEKWIRKRYRAPSGADWRQKNGFETQPMTGVFRSFNDWSDVDTGHPGAPSVYQKHQRLMMIQLCQDVYDAAMLVERAKNMPTSAESSQQ